MTDHADTIRDLQAQKHSLADDRMRLLGELHTALAERQQAIDERDAYKQQALSEGRLADDRLGIANEVAKKLVDSEARCEQAIDALRDLHLLLDGWLHTGNVPDREYAYAVVEGAGNLLLNLGETE